MKSILFRCLLPVLALLILVSTAISGQDKIAPRLAEKLTTAAENEILPVWVFFTDKGQNRRAQLDRVEQNLLSHARARRLRNRPADRLVDFYDIPVPADYVRTVARRVQRIRHKSRWLNAVSVEATAAQIGELKSLSFVKKLDIIHRFKGPEIPVENPVGTAPFFSGKGTHSLNYGASFTQVNQINVPALHDLGYDASGVIICMLDAGFNNLQHQALAPLNILHTWDFVNGDSIVWDEPGQMGSGNHGTATLGTIAGFAPGHLIGPAYGASFLLAKTENTDWERHIEEDDWVAGAEWGDSLGADVISSSLGYRDFDPGQTSYTWQDMDGNTTIVVKGADIAASRGIIVVNSAGNEGSSTPSNPNTLVSPSDGDSVLAVGAVGSSGQRVSFSSMGPTADGRIKPDVMAMGSGVVAPSTSSPTGYNSVSGTSFSCPLTAGAAALILQVNPNLSNMQIIRAMRQTADNATSPNNSYGWGIVNAFQAAFYYTPQITHTPLPDVEDVTGPYLVTATITSQFNLTSDSVQVFYRYDQGSFQSVLLQNVGGDQYEAQIPGPGASADVFYYLRAKTDSGTVATHPAHAPQDLHSFHVGPDVTPPTIAHTPLQNVAYISWPATVKAFITDNLGVDDSQVFVEWKKNGVAQTNFPLLRVQGDLFTGAFNSDTNQVQVGDLIEYRIHAADLATVPNTIYDPVNGYYQFNLLQTRGLVLVIDDESGTRGMIESRGQTVNYQPDGTNSASNLMEHYLSEMSFLVVKETVSNTDPNTWGQYGLIISASGENPSPVSSSVYRQALIQHVQNGGKVLVEGGEVGYDAISGVGYPNFAAQVLHVNNWNGDNEGPLTLISSQSQHPLVTQPNQLPGSFTLDYNSFSGWYDQDAMTPDGQSYLIYYPQNASGDAGILVFDDNSNPASAQIVYWAFDFSSIMDTTAAKHLLENTVTYLLTDDSPLAIDGRNEAIPRKLKLFTNYPNPFNPQTTIRFQLPVAGRATLAVYNSLGQKVEQLSGGFLSAGEHKVVWDASDKASGVYYVVLKSNGYRVVHKALLMK